MMLQFQSVSFGYKQQPILKNIDVSLASAEMLGVIGANGAGKSAFIQLAANLLLPSSGQITWWSQSAAQFGASDRAKKIAYLPQSPQVDWPLTVRQVAALGRLPHQTWTARENDRDILFITDALLQTDMTAFADRRMDTLSGGERMRAMIARLFATRATLLLADEPIAALDILHQLQILQLFKQHCQQGGSAIIALHDLNMAARFCDKLLLLHQGSVLAFGEPAQVLTPRNLATAFGVRTIVSELGDHLTVQFNLP